MDLLDLVITEIVHDAQNHGEKERIRTLRDLDAAALQLWDTLQVLLDDSVDISMVRQKTFAQIPRDQVLEAGAQVVTLTRPPDDKYYPELVERYRRVRRFLPTLLSHVVFEGTQAGQPVLAAWRFLTQIEHQRHPAMQQAPLHMPPAAWRRLVLPRHEPEPDRHGRIPSVRWNACKIACADVMFLCQKVSAGVIHGSNYYKVHSGKR